jgi:hypothetical protein
LAHRFAGPLVVGDVRNPQQAGFTDDVRFGNRAPRLVVLVVVRGVAVPVRELVLVRFGLARGLAEEAACALVLVATAHLDLDGLAVRRRKAEAGGVGQERALGLGLHLALR